MNSIVSKTCFTWQSQGINQPAGKQRDFIMPWSFKVILRQSQAKSLFVWCVLGARGGNSFIWVPVGKTQPQVYPENNQNPCSTQDAAALPAIGMSVLPWNKQKFAAKHLNRYHLHVSLCALAWAVSAIERSQVLCTAMEILSRQSFCQKKTIFLVFFSLFWYSYQLSLLLVRCRLLLSADLKAKQSVVLPAVFGDAHLVTPGILQYFGVFCSILARCSHLGAKDQTRQLFNSKRFSAPHLATGFWHSYFGFLHV